MAVLVGIDEAGYGPLLGPLVVSSTAFSLPDSLLKANLWKLLSDSVGQKKRTLAGRLLVTDSKKAYHKSRDLHHLQKPVLACLNCLGKVPENIGGLIESLAPDCASRLANYPWYKNLQDYPLSSDPADISIASSVLKSNLTSNRMEILALESRCLDVAHYNTMVGNVKNKANVLFTAISSLMKNSLDRFGTDNLQIVVDRQSGRVDYTRPLRLMFPNMELKVIRQDKKIGSYELAGNNQKMRLHFAVDADNRYLPVSLASMASKYLRQLLVGRINHYFISHHPTLKPTAGYWKDGLRFIKDLKQNVPHLQYESAQLIRCR